MSEKSILALSIKDFFTLKMFKYAVMPFFITVIVMYGVFFYLAGLGLDALGSMQIQTTQSVLQDGNMHTQSLTAYLEGLEIVKFLMNYALTSWIASFLVYALGSFFVLYVSIFMAVIVIGFLTPYVLKELHARHYKDVEMIGFSNILEGILLTIKWVFVMLLLFVLFMPFYFIPLVNIVAFNFPLYYFFHKMINYDVASNITTKDEFLKIKFFNKTSLRIKTLVLYLISLIPFSIFFGAIFYVIYMGHTYFLQTKKIRSSS